MPTRLAAAVHVVVHGRRRQLRFLQIRYFQRAILDRGSVDAGTMVTGGNGYVYVAAGAPVDRRFQYRDSAISARVTRIDGPQVAAKSGFDDCGIAGRRTWTATYGSWTRERITAAGAVVGIT